MKRLLILTLTTASLLLVISFSKPSVIRAQVDPGSCSCTGPLGGACTNVISDNCNSGFRAVCSTAAQCIAPNCTCEPLDSVGCGNIGESCCTTGDQCNSPYIPFTTFGVCACIAPTPTDTPSCDLTLIENPLQNNTDGQVSITFAEPNSTYVTGVVGCTSTPTVTTNSAGAATITVNCSVSGSHYLLVSNGSNECGLTFESYFAPTCVLTLVDDPLINYTDGQIDITSAQPDSTYDGGVNGCTVTTPVNTDAEGTASININCSIAESHFLLVSNGNGDWCSLTFKSLASEDGELFCDPTGINTAIGCVPVGNARDLSQFLLSWGLGIGGGIAFVLIVYAGFMIMTGSGNPQRIQAGKELLISALSGLILMIVAVFILRLLGIEILRIPGLRN